MRVKEKKQSKELREQGLSYREIANQLGMNLSTVKAHCLRHNIKSHRCLQCGEVVVQNPHKKEKKFCSDKCRMKWWNHQYAKHSRKSGSDS